MSAVNVTAAQAEIVSNIAAVVSVGLVVLLVYVALSSLKTIRDALGGVGEVDHWAGYTAADDARDRAAAGLDRTELTGRMADAEQHAMQLQMLGEGQSVAYANAISADRFDDDWAAFEREQSREK
jgi:hypothetical protein